MPLTNKQDKRITLHNSLFPKDRLINKNWNYSDDDIIPEEIFNKFTSNGKEKFRNFNIKYPGYKITLPKTKEDQIAERLFYLNHGFKLPSVPKGGKKSLKKFLKKHNKRKRKTKKAGSYNRGEFETVHQAIEYILKKFPQDNLDEASNYEQDYSSILKDLLIQYISDNFDYKFKNYTKYQLKSDINNLIYNKEKMFRLFDKNNMVRNDYEKEEMYNNLFSTFIIIKHGSDFNSLKEGYYGGSKEDCKNKPIECFNNVQQAKNHIRNYLEYLNELNDFRGQIELPQDTIEQLISAIDNIMIENSTIKFLEKKYKELFDYFTTQLSSDNFENSSASSIEFEIDFESDNNIIRPITPRPDTRQYDAATPPYDSDYSDIMGGKKNKKSLKKLVKKHNKRKTKKNKIHTVDGNKKIILK